MPAAVELCTSDYETNTTTRCGVDSCIGLHILSLAYRVAVDVATRHTLVSMQFVAGGILVAVDLSGVYGVMFVAEWVCEDDTI